MITSFDIYILTRLDVLNTLLVIMLIVFGLGCIFGLVVIAIITEENETIKQIPENFAKIINEKLQEWMKDINLIEENKEKK